MPAYQSTACPCGARKVISDNGKTHWTTAGYPPGIGHLLEVEAARHPNTEFCPRDAARIDKALNNPEGS